MTPLTGINLAIKQAGGISALARKLGISHQVVNRWHKRGHVPAKPSQPMTPRPGIKTNDLG